MDQDKIWDYFQNANSKSFDGNYSRLKYIANSIKSNEVNVLNIGIGNGQLEEILLSNSLNVCSLDPSEKSISLLRDRLGISASNAKTGYSQCIPWGDGFFDVVIMSEVIEHLDDSVLSETIKEVHRVLKKSGRFIGTVPADEDLTTNYVICPKCGELFHRWGHVRNFTSDSLAQLLNGTFTNVRVLRKYFGDWPSMNWKGRIVMLLKLLALYIGISGSSENFYFSANKS